MTLQLTDLFSFVCWVFSHDSTKNWTQGFVEAEQPHYQELQILKTCHFFLKFPLFNFGNHFYNSKKYVALDKLQLYHILKS